MAGIVDLLHPGPVLHVPKGARNPTLSLVPMRTPVRLREVDPRELPEVAGFDAAKEWHVYHEMEGKLWKSLAGSREWGFSTHLDGDSLKGILEGTMPPDIFVNTDIMRALEGSPLLGPTKNGARKHDLVDLAASRQVLDDARDEAAACVRRWVDERIVLAGGKVFARAHVPLGCLVQAPTATNRHDVHVRPYPACWRAGWARKNAVPYMHLDLLGFPFRLDRLSAAHELVEGRLMMAFPDSQETVYRKTGIPSRLFEDDDLALMANVLPATLLAGFRHVAKAAAPGVDLSRVNETASELMPYAVRGAVGMYGPPDAEEVLEKLAHHCAALSDALGDHVNARYRTIAHWYETVAMPRLEERRLAEAMAPEDEAALGDIPYPGM